MPRHKRLVKDLITVEEAIDLHHNQKLNHVEIAAIKGVSPGAINTFFHKNGIPVIHTNAKKREYDVKLPKEYLYRRYHLENATLADLERETGIADSVIATRMADLGIPAITSRRGADKRIDMTNMQCGGLRVIGFAKSEKRITKSKSVEWRAYWHCECVCGARVVCCGRDLRRGDAVSCGKCPWKTSSDRTVPQVVHTVALLAAAKREIPFHITLEDIADVYREQDGTCALSGLPVTFSHQRGKSTASIDRIDSQLGYTRDNIQIVHVAVNWMKLDLPQDLFIRICEEVAKTHQSNPDLPSLIEVLADWRDRLGRKRQKRQRETAKND